MNFIDNAAHKVRTSRQKGGMKPGTHHFFYVFVWLMGWVAPPLAVAVRFGIGRDFFINVLCTICGYFPGHGHNFYCQTIRNNRNAARTPKWAVKYGLVKVEDKRGGKHQWAGRYDERLPDSSRYGYGENESIDEEGSVNSSNWDGRGPEPQSKGRMGGSGGERYKSGLARFAPWDRTVEADEVEGGPPPRPEGDEFGNGGRGGGAASSYDPLENESFYESGNHEGTVQHQPSANKLGKKKGKGIKGILSHRNRYEDTSSASSYSHDTSGGRSGDRFDRMKAARGDEQRDSYSGGNTEYMDDFEREINGASSTPSASYKPPTEARYDSFDNEGPEDAWGSVSRSKSQSTAVRSQATGGRLASQKTGASSYKTTREQPEPLIPTRTGGTVQGTKEDDDLFNHTF